MPSVLELRHVEPEGPGAYTPLLERYAPVETRRLWVEPLPQHPAYSAIVVMGGPMSANDGASLPWIDEEIAFLRRAVHEGVPVWGVCLGAQLLAAALGAEVRAGDRPEVGVLDVELTSAGAADPVWGTAPGVFSALQWHGDTFDLPDGAELLASSPAYRNQLFRHGNSYGVQFHLEATSDLVRKWFAFDEYVASAEAALGAGAESRLTSDVESSERESTQLAERVMTRWLDLV